MNYKVKLTYTRPSGTTTSAFVEVAATSDEDAVARAKRQLTAEPTRRIAEWGICEVTRRPWSSPAVEAAYNAAVLSALVGDKLTYRGRRAVVVATFTDTRNRDKVVIEDDLGVSSILNIRDYRKAKEPPVTVEYVSVYPHGGVYVSEFGPVRNSQYGVENLIQIKVTKRDGQIIAKELV